MSNVFYIVNFQHCFLMSIKKKESFTCVFFKYNMVNIAVSLSFDRASAFIPVRFPLFHMTNTANRLLVWILARGPGHLSTPQDVNMDVVDRLPSIWSIIDNNSVAIGQTCLLSTLLGNNHQVTQQCTVILLSF